MESDRTDSPSTQITLFKATIGGHHLPSDDIHSPRSNEERNFISNGHPHPHPHPHPDHNNLQSHHHYQHTSNNHNHFQPHHHHHNHHHHHHHQQHHHHQPHQHQNNQRSMDLVFKNLTLNEPCSRHQKHESSRLLQRLAGLKLNGTASNPKNHSEPVDRVPAARKILDDVSGFAKSGQLLGVLGPSGSGKTTFLNILSGRLKPDHGLVTLNGDGLSKQIRRKICYVLQHDIFFPDLTLKQTLMYTAMLRLPESMSKQEKMLQVENMIELLDLRQCENTIIGDILRRGLSGGEKKRANIACELLSNPSVMLLDEPTSGLDSATALNIMKFLKEYAVKERKIIITSIHQPSSQIFYLFDKLLLLSTGKLAYFGDIDKVIPFFSQIGFQITPNYNPADFMMDRIKGPSEDQAKIIQAAQKLDKSPPNSQRPSSNRHHHSSHGSHNNHQMDHHSGETLTKEGDDHFETDMDPGERKDEFLESNPLWSNHHADECESRDHPGSDTHVPGADNMKGIELRVVIDPGCKRINKIYHKIVNDDDSGRSSWTETDRSSTSTFSASSFNGSTEEMQFGKNGPLSSRCSSTSKIWDSDYKWPTSFWTQFKVLAQRNYYESRGRMLSKLNWIQTIFLGLITGLLWFQVPRTESSINDIRGWMFFATSYWMLFELFGALVSIPPEREVVNKERASGAYRLSAYYFAKIIGELPSTLALPSVYHLVSYPMFSCYSIKTFLLQWVFLILNSIVAQTIGFVIGVTSNDLEISVTISALYSMTTNLFGGFYSSMIPSWLTWVKYLSIVHYAFHNMQIIEVTYGPPIRCSTSESIFSFCSRTNSSSPDKSGLVIPPKIILSHLEAPNSKSEPFPIWLNTLILLQFLVLFQIFGYLILRYLRKPK